MNGHYILQNGEPRLIQVYTADGQLDEQALLEWAMWFEHADERRVALTQVHRATVSTIFLGVDHSWGGGPPLLFETMVCWPGGNRDEQERYTTLDEARAGHEQMVAWVRRQWWRALVPAWLMPDLAYARSWLVKSLQAFVRQE